MQAHVDGGDRQSGDASWPDDGLGEIVGGLLFSIWVGLAHVGLGPLTWPGALVLVLSALASRRIVSALKARITVHRSSVVPPRPTVTRQMMLLLVAFVVAAAVVVGPTLRMMNGRVDILSAAGHWMAWASALAIAVMVLVSDIRRQRTDWLWLAAGLMGLLLASFWMYKGTSQFRLLFLGMGLGCAGMGSLRLIFFLKANPLSPEAES